MRAQISTTCKVSHRINSENWNHFIWNYRSLGLEIWVQNGHNRKFKTRDFYTYLIAKWITSVDRSIIKDHSEIWITKFRCPGNFLWILQAHISAENGNKFIEKKCNGLRSNGSTPGRPNYVLWSERWKKNALKFVLQLAGYSRCLANCNSSETTEGRQGLTVGGSEATTATWSGRGSWWSSPRLLGSASRAPGHGFGRRKCGAGTDGPRRR
jgi:hypothetical protein